MYITELELLTADLAATKNFYSNMLQFKPAEESATHCCFAAGNSLLRYVQATEGRPFYHIAFGIPNNHLFEAINWISTFTSILPYSVTEQIADFEGWNAKAFYFHDNNSNILEFITHYDWKLYSDNTFTSSEITGICEIGIVVDDVPAVCNVITANYQLPLFEKGPHLADFSVIGNSNGMFIVTKEGRGWLPTFRPCEYFPVRVVVEEKQQLHTIDF